MWTSHNPVAAAESTTARKVHTPSVLVPEVRVMNPLTRWVVVWDRSAAMGAPRTPELSATARVMVTVWDPLYRLTVSGVNVNEFTVGGVVSVSADAGVAPRTALRKVRATVRAPTSETATRTGTRSPRE